MANGTGTGGRVVRTRRRGRRGDGGWRRGKGSKARRGGGSDGTSDEEYIVVEDEDEDDGSSYDPSSSDASQEEPDDSEGASYTEEEEEEEEEEYDVSDDEEPTAATGRRPRKGAKSKAKPLRRRKSQPIPRRWHRIRAEDEEDEYEDEDNEDFAPDGDEDQSAKPPARKTVRRNKGPVKRRRKCRDGNATKRGRRKKAPVKKRKRSSVHSSDDDFVVNDRALVERADRKKRRKKGVSKGKKRRSRAPPLDMLDSESSDFDYRVSEEELRDLLGGEQGTVSHAYQGKGKEILESEKQICGICLSEEQKGAVRGLLDCCTHYFCFDCIMEWSKMESRCPLCKQRFKTVSQSTSSGAVLGLRAAVKRIPKRDQVYQPSDEEVRNHQDPYADIVCMECQRGGDDHLMLLCDICDSPAHTYCVGHGREVPEGNWYCDDCRPMNPGSSNPDVLESCVEYETRNTELLLDNRGENDSVDVTKCTPHESTGQSATQSSPRRTVSEDGQDASSRCHSSLGVQGASSLAPGFAASTVSRRRSIHERIRTLLFNNRVGRIPEGVARNVIAQPTSVQSAFYGSEIEQSGETFHIRKESLVKGVTEGSNRVFLAPRRSIHPCTHNEVSGLNVVEGTKSQVQSMVKNHLKRLTRDNALERREFKDIARCATHTILAACGLQHRGSMVYVRVRPPSSCGHQGDGELADLVKECCSSCFSSFVGNIVQRLVNSKLRPT